jgi:ABC-type microcin C transport system duplicated ATPase subunit YejF
MDLSEPLRSNAPPPVPLLDIKDLTVEFSTRRGIVKAVQSINIEVAKGETWRSSASPARQVRHLVRRDAHSSIAPGASPKAR